jgi:hypothetical protein
MDLREAQDEVRWVFVGGALGQIITGVVWLLSAALGTWVNRPLAILALLLGGMVIFPLTQLVLKFSGRPSVLSRDNPLSRYSLHAVIAMGATFPLVYLAARCNLNWFYPAFMIIVGAHYVMFIHLYGMWQYGVLAAALIGGGIALVVPRSASFALGGWLAGAALVIYGVLIWITHPEWRHRLARAGK